MDVAAWLRDLGLARYEEAFRDSDIDADVLPDLTEADLEKLGVSLGHRKKLLKAIAELRRTIKRRHSFVFAGLGHGRHCRKEQNRRGRAPPAHGAVLRPGRARRSCRRGSTPRTWRDVIRAYQNAVTGEIARLEGHVAKYMGDGVLAYFGWPQAHEDDAERAVRAGLAIIEAVGQPEQPWRRARWRPASASRPAWSWSAS